ncbi:MAG TPA: SH3 domain-containing protein [Candidatus Ventricola gallistercoris]|nr:SH3 domain-containing protein [Candidatus Ventricola gallistercoris]
MLCGWIRRGLCLVLLSTCMLPSFALAQSAVVDNGSDPDSRLNMRKEPSADSASLGKFYSGTEVEILSDAGDGWSQVSIGGGQNSLDGYMMSDYLSTDGEGVIDATFDMEVVSPYGTQSVVLRSKPSDSFDAVAMLEVGEAVRVIGVSGNFYYVQMDDDSVGCLDSSELH